MRNGGAWAGVKENKGTCDFVHVAYMTEWRYIAWLSSCNLARVKTEEEPLLRIKENQ